MKIAKYCGKNSKFEIRNSKLRKKTAMRFSTLILHFAFCIFKMFHVKHFERKKLFHVKHCIKTRIMGILYTGDEYA